VRILWVKIGGLWPPNTGGRLRSFHLVSELSRRHRVMVVTTHAPGEDPESLGVHLPRAEDVVSIPYAIPKRGSWRFAAALLQSWWSRLPVDLLKFRVPGVIQAVRERLDARSVDICVADFFSATADVPMPTSVPVVFFAHNVEYMIWKRLCEAERHRPLRRLLLALEWRKLRRSEARACARASMTLTVSEADRARLAADAAGATIRAIPTGVDTSYFAPDGSEEIPATLVFTGSMDWYPNEDAVLYFLESILPRIRREVPGTSFSIVGRSPTARVIAAAAASAGVRVTGTVDDVRPHVARAAVYVVPLRVGGGTRLKIFEALAMGKAVVSTQVGAEGLPLESGRHFMQADDPADFATAVVTLLRDPRRRRELGVAGRQLVETRYSWRQVAREFEERCAQVLTLARKDLTRGPASSGSCPVESLPAGARSGS
jgi:sugar transferase (PEP-CTERM/EpsH1 system associated)